MAKPSKRKRGHESPNFWLGKGLLALVVGAVLLFGSLAVGEGRPLTAALSLAMSMPAWWAIGIGMVLVLVHAVTKFTHLSRSMPLSVAPQPIKKRGPPPGSVIQALIDQAEYASFLADADALPATPLPTKLGEVFFDPATVAPYRNPWGSELFAALNAAQFDAVCETLFGQAGFQARVLPRSVTSARCIGLYSKTSLQPAALVFCKQGDDQLVGLSELRAFYELMTSCGVIRGTFTTASDYSPAALDYARAKGINALDTSSLLRLIAKRSPEQQLALLDAAAAAFTNPALVRTH